MSDLRTSLQQYQNQKLLILGWGREGKSSYALFRKYFPKKEIWVADQKTPSLESMGDSLLFVESGYLSNLQEYQVIFKTSGVPIHLTELQKYQQAGGVVTSQTNEFMKVFRDQVIGVTGTKGKSTTSAMIHHLLKTAGKSSLLVGNIGTPVFTLVDEIKSDTLIVVELSSYQLETLQTSPHIAVFVSIFPEHLNYHGSFDQYLKAKAQITLHQTEKDIFIFNSDEPSLQEIAQKTRAKQLPFSPKHDKEIFSDFEITQEITEHLAPVIRRFTIPPAFLVAQELGLTTNQIAEGLKTFQPLPHRLEKVGEYRSGITFIDDTLATIPEAAAEALDAYPNTSVMILGGYDRGLDFSPIVEKLRERQVPTVILFKPSGEKIAKLLEEQKDRYQPQMFIVETMKEAVQLAYQHAQPQTTVLLSPASPSYGTFKDYEDKSAQFVHYVKELA